MASKLQTLVEKEILDLLDGSALSVAELADQLKRNYHTTRNAVRSLQQRGLVKPKDLHTFRNTKYVLGSADGFNSVMPTITNNGQQFKLIEVLNARHSEPTAAKAVRNLPMHVTRLLVAAHKLHKNKIVTPDNIKMIRTAMEQDLERLETSVSAYKQILDNHIIWDTAYLQKFPRDSEFDESEVMRAYEHYYATTEEQ